MAFSPFLQLCHSLSVRHFSSPLFGPLLFLLISFFLRPLYSSSVGHSSKFLPSTELSTDYNDYSSSSTEHFDSLLMGDGEGDAAGGKGTEGGAMPKGTAQAEEEHQGEGATTAEEEADMVMLEGEAEERREEEQQPMVKGVKEGGDGTDKGRGGSGGASGELIHSNGGRGGSEEEAKRRDTGGEGSEAGDRAGQEGNSGDGLGNETTASPERLPKEETTQNRTREGEEDKWVLHNIDHVGPISRDGNSTPSGHYSLGDDLEDDRSVPLLDAAVERCHPKLDLVFLLDTSGSIEQLFREHVRWAVSLVESLPLEKDTVRVAAVQYAGFPLTEFALGTYPSANDIQQHLRRMKFQTGGTRTGYALRKAELELFRPDRGARTDAGKVIVLFTDGLSVDDPLKPAKQLREHKNVKIFIVSIFDDALPFHTELNRISGKEENIFGPGPDELERLRAAVLTEAERAQACIRIGDQLPFHGPIRGGHSLDTGITGEKVIREGGTTETREGKEAGANEEVEEEKREEEKRKEVKERGDGGRREGKEEERRRWRDKEEKEQRKKEEGTKKRINEKGEKRKQEEEEEKEERKKGEQEKEKAKKEERERGKKNEGEERKNEVGKEKEEKEREKKEEGRETKGKEGNEEENGNGEKNKNGNRTTEERRGQPEEKEEERTGERRKTMENKEREEETNRSEEEKEEEEGETKRREGEKEGEEGETKRREGEKEGEEGETKRREGEKSWTKNNGTTHSEDEGISSSPLPSSPFSSLAFDEEEHQQKPGDGKGNKTEGEKTTTSTTTTAKVIILQKDKEKKQRKGHRKGWTEYWDKFKFLLPQGNEPTLTSDVPKASDQTVADALISSSSSFDLLLVNGSLMSPPSTYSLPFPSLPIAVLPSLPLDDSPEQLQWFDADQQKTPIEQNERKNQIKSAMGEKEEKRGRKEAEKANLMGGKEGAAMGEKRSGQENGTAFLEEALVSGQSEKTNLTKTSDHNVTAEQKRQTPHALGAVSLFNGIIPITASTIVASSFAAENDGQRDDERGQWKGRNSVEEDGTTTAHEEKAGETDCGDCATQRKPNNRTENQSVQGNVSLSSLSSVERVEDVFEMTAEEKGNEGEQTLQRTPTKSQAAETPATRGTTGTTTAPDTPGAGETTTAPDTPGAGGTTTAPDTPGAGETTGTTTGTIADDWSISNASFVDGPSVDLSSSTASAVDTASIWSPSNSASAALSLMLSPSVTTAQEGSLADGSNNDYSLKVPKGKAELERSDDKMGQEKGKKHAKVRNEAMKKAFGVVAKQQQTVHCPSLDVLFIVDSSGSVQRIYEEQKRWLEEILCQIQLEEPEKGPQVALIQFAGADLQKTEWGWNRFRNSEQMMNAFHQVRHLTGTTFIGKALQLAAHLLERRRRPVPALVVLLSDDNAVQSAQNLRVMANTQFYALSISEMSNTEYLHRLTANPSHVFIGRTGADLLRAQIFRRIRCDT